MKTLKITLLLFFILSESCAQKNKRLISLEDPDFGTYFLNPQNVPQVHGKIVRLNKGEAEQINITYNILSHFNIQTKLAKVNPDGSFELKLDYAFPFQKIWVSIDSLFGAYVYANEGLFIELDAKVLKSKHSNLNIGKGIKYGGPDGKLNNYMNKQAVYMQDYQNKIRSAIAFLRKRDMPIEDFIAKYDSMQNFLRYISKKYMDENKSKYWWIIVDESYSEYYSTLCDKYAQNLVKTGTGMSQELWEKLNKHKPMVVSSYSVAFYNAISMYTYCTWVTSRKKGIHEGLVLKDLVEAYDSAFLQGKADFLKIKLKIGNYKEAKLLYETVLPTIKTDWCKSAMQSEWNTSLEYVKTVNDFLSTIKSLPATGNLGRLISQNPNGANLYVADSLKATELLVNLRNMFKGKALFIDFWSTTCSGCLEEMPYSKKLEKEIADLPIEFVYLCNASGTKQDNWRAVVSKHELTGTHVFVNKAVFNELMSLFSLSAVPSYIFIDANGICKQGIKRPSFAKRESFAELIGER